MARTKLIELEERVQKLHRMLKLANAELKIAARNVEEANKAVGWANKQLQLSQERERKLRAELVKAYELPPPVEVERVCRTLEDSYGMVGQDLADDAAKLIRKIWRARLNGDDRR